MFVLPQGLQKNFLLRKVMSLFSQALISTMKDLSLMVWENWFLVSEIPLIFLS